MKFHVKGTRVCEGALTHVFYTICCFLKEITQAKPTSTARGLYEPSLACLSGTDNYLHIYSHHGHCLPTVHRQVPFLSLLPPQIRELLLRLKEQLFPPLAQLYFKQVLKVLQLPYRVTEA